MSLHEQSEWSMNAMKNLERIYLHPHPQFLPILPFLQTSHPMFSIIKDTTISQTSLEEILSQSPYTLLYFYPKDDTPWCTIEAQEFTALQEDFAHAWVQIVWVSRDDEQSHCDFVSKYSLSPTYISDPELILHKQYWAWGEKNNYGKIVTWVIRSTILLDKSGTVIHERHNIKATWHAARVYKKLSDLFDLIEK